MVLWRQTTKAQAIPGVCCAIEVLLQRGEKRTNSQKLPLASTQLQSINGHIFFSLSINQVRDIAKCIECLPSMYGCPAVEPSKQDSVVLCTYNPNTWETVAEKLPTVSSISAWTTYWAMVRTCSQIHISILSYRLNILRSLKKKNEDILPNMRTWAQIPEIHMVKERIISPSCLLTLKYTTLHVCIRIHLNMP